MIYALKQCGTSRPSALVRRTDLPNARFPARLDSAESFTTPWGVVVGKKELIYDLYLFVIEEKNYVICVFILSCIEIVMSPILPT